jgi:hypothetical protein
MTFTQLNPRLRAPVNNLICGTRAERGMASLAISSTWPRRSAKLPNGLLRWPRPSRACIEHPDGLTSTHEIFHTRARAASGVWLHLETRYSRTIHEATGEQHLHAMFWERMREKYVLVFCRHPTDLRRLVDHP